LFEKSPFPDKPLADNARVKSAFSSAPADQPLPVALADQPLPVALAASSADGAAVSYAALTLYCSMPY
jgi:hypothetical protein